MFSIAVLIIGLTLLLTKLIKIEDITNNWYTIGIALSTLYAWWKVDEKNKENQKLKNDIQQLKMDSSRNNCDSDPLNHPLEMREKNN